MLTEQINLTQREMNATSHVDAPLAFGAANRDQPEKRISFGLPSACSQKLLSLGDPGPSRSRRLGEVPVNSRNNFHGSGVVI